MQYLDINTCPSLIYIFAGLIVDIVGLNLLQPVTVGLELLSYRVPSFVASSASRAEESRLSARGQRTVTLLAGSNSPGHPG